MKKFALSSLIVLLSFLSAYSGNIDDVQTKRITNDSLKMFPVYDNGRIYFFLQSIDEITQIVIGDFSQGNQKIILINLGRDYTTIHSVVEYYPASRTMRLRKDSDSKFFPKDITKFKRDIITGDIFKEFYSDQMRSYDTLERIFKQNEVTSISQNVYGFTVKQFDPDEEKKFTSIFSFGKTQNGYYMQFQTLNYRENSTTVKIPKIKYSVYCKNTQDPVIKEYVENLFKIRAPTSTDMK